MLRSSLVVLTQGLIDAHEQFKSTLGEADREYQGILALCTEAAQLASQYSLLNENPYTSIQVRQILEIYLCLFSCFVSLFSQSEDRITGISLHKITRAIS